MTHPAIRNRSAAIAILAATTGCNAIFGLEPATQAADAADRDAGDDGDADGIPDDLDNCPARSNPDQHDEDIDGVGDTCDVCPHIADDQRDEGELALGGQADGVGDACDPRPATGGDRISVFDGFAGDTLASGWQHNGAPVTATGDQLVFSARSENLLLLWSPAAGDGEVTTIVARLHLTGYPPTPPPTSGYRSLGLTTRWHSTLGNHYICQDVDDVYDAVPADVRMLRRKDSMSSALASTPLSGPLPMDTRTLSLTEEVNQDQFMLRCTSVADVTTEAAGSDADLLVPGLAGLHAVAVDASVDWIIAIVGPAVPR